MFNINPFRCNLIRSLWHESLQGYLQNGIRSISTSSPLGFNITPVLMGNPRKKKKRPNPQLLKLREDRKRKKIDKELRMLEKVKKPLRPIEEAKTPMALHYEKDARRRLIHVPENVKEERILLEKEWTRYRREQWEKDVLNIHRIIKSQERALYELRMESVELYNAAIQIDPNLVPFTYTGPSDTPPLKGYNTPDGEYVDISKNWFEFMSLKK